MTKSTPNNGYHPPLDKEMLLADICEMYYLQGKNQAEIGKIIDLTPSMVSRLLTEARQRNMLEIRIRRPIQSDFQLENALKERFNLQAATVVTIRGFEFSWLKYLGAAGANVMKQYLKPDMVIGIAWGNTLRELVEAFDTQLSMPSKLVELTGALGSRVSEYEGHGITSNLARKLGAEHYFLNAPFLCGSAETASALLKDKVISQPLELAEKADIALMGVGSLDRELATVLRYGYLSMELIQTLRNNGAVGNVCGLYFDIYGNSACAEFCKRIITISREDLFKIPVRIGISGGPDKAIPILGALRGGFINVLVTDNLTARAILAHGY